MFVGRRSQAIVFGVLTTIFGVVLCLSFSTWLSLGVGNPAKRAVHSLSESEAFRDEAARFFVEKLSEDAGSDATAVLDEKGDDIKQALSDLLGNEDFVSELDSISDSAYGWFVDGDSASANISVRPAVEQMIDTLGSVDSRFDTLRQGVAELDDLNLAGNDNESPRLGRFLSMLSIGVAVVFVLTLLFAFGYARAATSSRAALRFATWLLGACALLSLGLWFGANRAAEMVAADQNEALARIALPLVASSLTAPFRSLGLVCLAGAVATFVLVVRGRRRLIAETSVS